MESGPTLAGLEVRWPNWEGVDLVFAGDGPGHAPGSPAAGAPAAFEARRIEAGVPRIGHEITERTIPHEAGLLVDHTVSFTKGCYTGQELVARLDARGNNVPRRLVGVIGGDDREGGDRLAFGMTLHAGEPEPADVATDKVVGTVTSAAWSPELEAWVALAYLHRTVDAPGPVRVRSGDGLGGSRPARVALLPLLGDP
jgi:folate-binding protein YgfZ